MTALKNAIRDARTNIDVFMSNFDEWAQKGAAIVWRIAQRNTTARVLYINEQWPSPSESYDEPTVAEQVYNVWSDRITGSVFPEMWKGGDVPRANDCDYGSGISHNELPIGVFSYQEIQVGQRGKETPITDVVLDRRAVVLYEAGTPSFARWWDQAVRPQILAISPVATVTEFEEINGVLRLKQLVL